MAKKDRRLFCDINPFCYRLSVAKETFKRHIKNLTCRTAFAREISSERLPVTVAEHRSELIKRGKDIDPVLQENKAVNIKLACRRLNGLIIRPGEEFSFWITVGNTTKRKGYREGRVLVRGKLIAGMGGGLCNLANTIHRMVLCSPLEVTEFHSHSDALSPDHGKRIPFSSGTSVSYNYVDYRFKNTTDQSFQLILYCENGELIGKLCCEKDIPYSYELIEEGHHFSKEGEHYYRVSEIYRVITDKKTGKQLRKELILNNHSRVMYDPALIPKEQIK